MRWMKKSPPGSASHSPCSYLTTLEQFYLDKWRKKVDGLTTFFYHRRSYHDPCNPVNQRWNPAQVRPVDPRLVANSRIHDHLCMYVLTAMARFRRWRNARFLSGVGLMERVPQLLSSLFLFPCFFPSFFWYLGRHTTVVASCTPRLMASWWPA